MKGDSYCDAYRSGDADAARRIRQHMRTVLASDTGKARALALADAQFVVAREHGFDSWPKFAKHIETLTIAREVDALTDPVAAFFEAAGPPRAGHSSGTLERAEAIRARHPEVARSSIYAAAMVADEIGPGELYREDDGYFGIATDSTALHVAAWRAWPDVVKELIARGTPVDARDGRGERRCSSRSRPVSIRSGRNAGRLSRSPRY